jgi:type I restriction enzyme, S subunit
LQGGTTKQSQPKDCFSATADRNDVDAPRNDGNNAMQLLEHFKELTLHPKNAEELKGLILQLAVQGKLTRKWREENPDIEPASVLLEKVRKEKTRIGKETQARIQKETLEISESDYPYELPKSWVWCRLNDISLINGGFAFKSSEYVEEGVRVIRISDFDENGFKDGKIVRYNYSNDLSQYQLEPKNIIIAMTGGTVGKSFFIQELEELMVTNQRVATIKLIEPVFEAYVNCVVPTSLIQDVIEEAKNSTNDNISMADIKNFFIPFPPLAEQKAIVEVVNQLFDEVEQLEALTKERIQLKEDFVTSALNQLTQAAESEVADHWELVKSQFGTFFTEKSSIKKLREAILQLAVQGKLTHHWRSLRQAQGSPLESASVLLEKIKAEKEQLIKAGKIKKEKPLPEISEDEIPYDLPEGWVWCRMQDLCPNISSGSTPPQPYFKDEGIPYLKVYNIRNQKIDFRHKPQFVDQEYHNSKLKRSILKPGDVIMNIVGPPLGKIAIIPEDYPEWNCNQAISFFQPIDRRLNIWIYTYLTAGTFLENIELIGTAGQDNISVTKSKTIPIPLPPLEEQKAIVEKVNGLMALCDQLEQEIEIHHTTQEHWMQSCLREVV